MGTHGETAAGMDIHSAAALISEILTLVGLFPGAVLLIAGLSVRGFNGRWVQTVGVIASVGSETVIRWFDGGGEVYECAADTHETFDLVPGDDVSLWFSSRTPSRCRTHDPQHDGKALRLMGVILLAVGLAAAVLGLVLMFV